MHDTKTQPIARHIANFLYYGMRAAVLLSVTVFAIRADWVAAFSAVFIFLMMLAPSFLKEQYRMYLPFQLEVSIVFFIFLTLFLGSLANFYEGIAWWDDMLHFLSGILFGIFAFTLIYTLNSEQFAKLNLSPIFISFFSVCFSLALSVVWEVYEYAADYFFGLNMQRDGINDTMTDLIVNAVGAIIVGVAAYFWILRKHRVPFTPRPMRLFHFRRKTDVHDISPVDSL